MHLAHHTQITLQALQGEFSPDAMQVILRANHRQDNLRGQIMHPEYHFDASCFARGNAYISQQRELILEALSKGASLPARQAFGRLTHAVQDFYAHSNYVPRWQAQHPGATAEQIDPLDSRFLEGNELISGRLYYPFEVLAFVPGLEPLIKPFLPRDSHTWMNLDSPRQGPLYAFAFAAAVKRTRYEFDGLRASLSPSSQAIFTGAAIN